MILFFWWKKEIVIAEWTGTQLDSSWCPPGGATAPTDTAKAGFQELAMKTLMNYCIPIFFFNEKQWSCMMQALSQYQVHMILVRVVVAHSISGPICFMILFFCVRSNTRDSIATILSSSCLQNSGHYFKMYSFYALWPKIGWDVKSTFKDMSFHSSNISDMLYIL